MQQAGIVRHRAVGARERQDGVAQVGAGEVAHLRPLGRRSRRRARPRRGRPAPRPTCRRRQPPRQLRISRRRPALAGPTAPGASATTRGRPRSPGGCRHAATSAGGTTSSGSGHSAAAPCAAGSASTAQRSIMRGSLRSPQRTSLRRPKRASPAKPMRSGMPARKRRQRRLPGARHDQGGAVVLAPSRARARAVLAEARAAGAADRRRSPCAPPACSRQAGRTARRQRHRPAAPETRRSTLTTEWQRTKSPIHMYGTSRIGRGSVAPRIEREVPAKDRPP